MKSLEKRFFNHCQKVNLSSGNIFDLHRFMKEKSIINFKIEKVCECKNVKGLRRMEKYFINKFDTYNNGLNMNPGGGGTTIHSDETKRKISLKSIGNKNMLGHRHSDETKEKLRKANLGKSMQEEQKKNLSEQMIGNKFATAGKGKKHSKEWNEKVGKANKGKKRTPEQNEANRQRCLGRVPWNKGKRLFTTFSNV
jgi:hypothetical protein